MTHQIFTEYLLLARPNAWRTKTRSAFFFQIVRNKQRLAGQSVLGGGLLGLADRALCRPPTPRAGLGSCCLMLPRKPQLTFSRLSVINI